MPRFYETVDVDVDIDVDDFLDKCDSEDIEELIKSLKKDGHINIENMGIENVSYMEQKHRYYCSQLADSYTQMTSEDIEIIQNLVKKYGFY